MSKPIPEWCEKAATELGNRLVQYPYGFTGDTLTTVAAIIAEGHEKGCEFVHGEAEALRKLADIKQAVGELVEAARFYVKSNLEPLDALGTIIRGNAKAGLESAIAKVEGLL